MSRRSRIASLTLGALSGLPSLAHATTEPPTSFDARAMGMASTSVSHVHSGAAVYHNAALLHEVETLTLTLSLGANRVAQTAPLLGPNTSSESDPSTIPIFLLGGGYRLSEKFVLGLAAFTTGGFGGTYETPGGPRKVVLGATEISPTLTYAILDNLAVGVGYRITYMFQEAELPPMPGVPTTTIDLSGMNFLGFHAGVYFRPIDRLKLGLAYRSKVTVELDGTTDVAGLEADTTSEFAFPHAFKLGGQIELLEDSLFVAGEIRYLMHSEANEEIVTEAPPLVLPEQTLDWEDSIAFGVGAEYFVLPILPVRAGYLLTNSATPEDRPGPLYPAPGAQHSLHLGAGVRVPRFDIDVGGFYSWGGHDVTDPAPTMPPTFSGEYTMKVTAIAASVTYRQ